MKRKKSLIAATGLAAIVGVSSIVASPPQPANAAGFMENSFKNFTENGDIDSSIKSGVRFLAAVVYWLPIIVPVAALAGVAVSSHAQSDSGVKASIMIGLIVMAVIGLVWLYDSKMVGKVTASLPRPLQYAMLQAAKAGV